MSFINPKSLLAFFSVTALLWFVATVVVASIDCSTAIELMSGCSEYVNNGGADPGLGSPCCNGLVSLYNIAADAVENRRSACNCIMALITTYNPNATIVARLPGLCGISLGFTIDPNTDCSSIP